MENKFNISIPKPCHENWSTMLPDEKGRFCTICTKDVVDFTENTAEEIQNYFRKYQGQKICGRFNNEQINKFDIQIPHSVLRQQMPFHKAFLLSLFVVMGTTLFSCKNHNDATLGEVSVVEDTVETGRTLGIVLPSKDSVDIKVDANFVYHPSQLDVLPSYSENMDKFNHFFYSNFKVPEKCKYHSIDIFVTFIIERDGTLSDIKTLRNYIKEVDDEAIRVIKLSPKWNPGEIKGIKVRSSYNFPIHISPSEPQ